MDEYRRLADSFRKGEDLPLRDLWLLKALARKADNYRLVKQVSAQIKRRLDRLEW